jgi:hypothetical protein
VTGAEHYREAERLIAEAREAIAPIRSAYPPNPESPPRPNFTSGTSPKPRYTPRSPWPPPRSSRPRLAATPRPAEAKPDVPFTPKPTRVQVGTDVKDH